MTVICLELYNYNKSHENQWKFKTERRLLMLTFSFVTAAIYGN